MPATSKAQQRLFGQAYAVKKGELDPKDLDPEYRDEILDLADSMSLKKLKDYAETSHEGLPDKVEEARETFVVDAGDYKLFKTFRHGGMMTHIVKKNGKEIKQYAPNLNPRVAISKFQTEYGNMNEANLIKGGLADDKTVEDIAKKHGVSVEDIQKQMDMGVKVEIEHTKDPDVAKEIAMDHLEEIPDYYTRLADMEKEAESTNEGKMKELDSLIKDTTTRGLDIMDFLNLPEKDWNYFVHGKVWKDKVKSKDPKDKEKLMKAVQKRMNEMATPANTPGMGSTSFPSTDGGVGSGDIPHDLGATAQKQEEAKTFMTFEQFIVNEYDDFGYGKPRKPKYPDNIKKWLSKTATSAQKKAAKKVLPGWTGYIGGGTTVGMKPQTLLLDLSYQGGELSIDADGTIKAFGKEIKNQADFDKAKDKARNK